MGGLYFGYQEVARVTNCDLDPIYTDRWKGALLGDELVLVPYPGYLDLSTQLIARLCSELFKSGGLHLVLGELQVTTLERRPEQRKLESCAVER